MDSSSPRAAPRRAQRRDSLPHARRAARAAWGAARANSTSTTGRCGSTSRSRSRPSPPSFSGGAPA